MTDSEAFEYRNLPAGESWNLVSSLLYQDSPLLSDLCSDARVGWAFEDLFPYDLAVDLDAATDELHVGTVEGWIANWGSPLVVRERGDGRVCSCTGSPAATADTRPRRRSSTDSSGRCNPVASGRTSTPPSDRGTFDIR